MVVWEIGKVLFLLFLPRIIGTVVRTFTNSNNNATSANINNNVTSPQDQATVKRVLLQAWQQSPSYHQLKVYSRSLLAIALLLLGSALIPAHPNLFKEIGLPNLLSAPQYLMRLAFRRYCEGVSVNDNNGGGWSLFGGGDQQQQQGFPRNNPLDLNLEAYILEGEQSSNANEQNTNEDHDSSNPPTTKSSSLPPNQRFIRMRRIFDKVAGTRTMRRVLFRYGEDNLLACDWCVQPPDYWAFYGASFWMPTVFAAFIGWLLLTNSHLIAVLTLLTVSNNSKVVKSNAKVKQLGEYFFPLPNRFKWLTTFQMYGLMILIIYFCFEFYFISNDTSAAADDNGGGSDFAFLMEFVTMVVDVINPVQAYLYPDLTSVAGTLTRHEVFIRMRYCVMGLAFLALALWIQFFQMASGKRPIVQLDLREQQMLIELFDADNAKDEMESMDFFSSTTATQRRIYHLNSMLGEPDCSVEEKLQALLGLFAITRSSYSLLALLRNAVLMEDDLRRHYTRTFKEAEDKFSNVQYRRELRETLTRSIGGSIGGNGGIETTNIIIGRMMQEAVQLLVDASGDKSLLDHDIVRGLGSVNGENTENNASILSLYADSY